MKSPFGFPDLGEFQFIRRLLEGALDLPCAIPASREWLSAGDDAAQVDGWLITKDLSAEGTHFRFDWSSIEDAVEKHIVSNVSDISSMGGTPRLAFLGICCNKSWDDSFRSRLAKAFAQGFSKRGIALVGGDVIAADKGLFSLTLLGTPGKKVLKRSLALPGDNVYIAGSLGKSAAGLWLLSNVGKNSKEYARFENLARYHLAPSIDETLGKKLADENLANACIDLSDGLSSELNHIALSSNVSLRIDRKKIPIDSEVKAMANYFRLDPLDFTLNGGEEYQLLFTSAVSESIFNSMNCGTITKIGEVTFGNGVFLEDGCNSQILQAGAWTHL